MYSYHSTILSRIPFNRRLLRIKRKTSGLRLTLGVSTFVPKAHTPFQWEGLKPEAQTYLKQLRKKLEPQGIHVRPESYNWSVIQTLISTATWHCERQKGKKQGTCYINRRFVEKLVHFFRNPEHKNRSKTRAKTLKTCF